MTVNNVNALLNFTTPQTNQADQTGRQDGRTGDSFGQAMSKAGDTLKSLQTQNLGAASAVQPAQAADTAKTGGDMQTKEPEQTVESDPGKTGNAATRDDGKAVENTDAGGKTDAEQDEAVKEVEKSAKELVEQVADEMDVTTEEVEEAMAALGLVPAELFDVDNLKKLLLTIAGSEDELSLVTDETLYGSMKNLFAAVENGLQDLQQELGLSGEELSELLGQAVAAQEEQTAMAGEIPQQSDAETPELVQPTESETEPEQNLEGMKDYTVTVQRDGETVQMKVTVDDASGDKSVQEKVTDAPKEEVRTEPDGRTRERDASADSGRGEGNAAGGAEAFLQAMDKAEQIPETPAPVSAGYQSAQTQDIMNQIMDHMKINLKADVQELQMQLHPASLGTVNVQIASKDGAVTAHFTTQNETVRAVIETQLVQLKQQFEEQGIKVDAVEVTVANHQYGEQFSQEHENTNGQARKSAKGTRRINLDELDEEEGLEEMEETDRIAVEMMQASGNTVDYTA